MKGTEVICTELGFTYDGEERPALEGVTMAIRSGEWVAIVGPSGSGKSTLCQLLNGLLPRSGGGVRAGQVQLDGIDPKDAPLSAVTEAAGVLFQDPDAQLVQGIVEDEVAFGPENMRVPPEQIERRVQEALQAVRLLDRRADPVRSLSGGQRQRTAIAAVLALKPRLLVFDDACASLDAAAQADFLQLCRTLQAEGRTLITASGRFDDVARAAQRVIVLDGGRAVLDAPPEELLRRCGEQLAQLGVLPRAAGSRGAGPAGGPMAAPPAAGARAAALEAAASPAAAPPLASGAGALHAPATSAKGGPMAAPPAAGASSALLDIRELSFAYPGGRRALDCVNARLYPGEWVLLTGENGSGKTTLSRLIMGLLPARSGSLYWQGADMAALPVYRRAEHIGYVFQQPEHTFTAWTVWDELVYALHAGAHSRDRTGLAGDQLERASFLLEAAGLVGREQISPYLLSQSEKRLLSLISQLVIPKPLYILDEPTSGMDYAAIDRVNHLCRFVIGEGAAVLMITHDPGWVQEASARILHLEDGKVKTPHSAGQTV
ncbi:ABC transporter ATP-binding protein [Paenibacillus sp. 7541]|nr:ATP-binding cassette domain-containing protein [Paenibacillus sp. 7541]PAK51486.1 ABC transporter [Paenibacillus sp. 7541]